ncbi:endoglucanase 12-like [Salvia hispanica]|uniref:endoglucanase 12-like n=1 Tax=Salvia hispanica TaxID=49212 RepID=UPI002009B059|nr:endoglucanase 12-like [Salvia hispanica]
MSSGLRYLSFGLCVVLLLLQNGAASFDYGDALTKSLLYFEAQRSGKLPPHQRVQWRGDSALRDGNNAGINLVGGYYDAGDNVKFGLPMAFTVTMLAWSVVQFGPQLEARKELWNALNAIKWGTDYMIKAHPEPNVLYGQVGEGGSNHACWQRPEDMTTPRPAYKIDAQHPGSDLAAETAAALAAASIAFNAHGLRTYSSTLLNHAKQLFEFATKYIGQYQNSIPTAGQFYSSSGYEDELVWAAAWLGRATNDNNYHNFITKSSNSGGARTMFSWDDKYAGAQLLVAMSTLEKKMWANGGEVYEMKNNGEQFLCNCIQKGSFNVPRTYAGLLWFQEWNNLHYVATASFLAAAYAETLANTRSTIQCPHGPVSSYDLVTFARSQVDYILGLNPKGMSYMVGFGTNYPKRVHHRGASIVSIKKDPRPVSCQGGFEEWFHKNADNPNVVYGAVVGGPNRNDEYNDKRENYQQAEPATANVAPLVGVLASLALRF